MRPHEETLLMLQCILSCTLDHPTFCRIVVNKTGDHIEFAVTPHPNDVGKVIGKSGRTARALRNLLMMAARKHRANYSLDIVTEQDELICVHCGCTELTACQTNMGNCHWVSNFLPVRVCSNIECIEKEMAVRCERLLGGLAAVAPLSVLVNGAPNDYTLAEKTVTFTEPPQSGGKA